MARSWFGCRRPEAAAALAVLLLPGALGAAPACRDEVRPLLLERDPPAGRVAAARGRCAAAAESGDMDAVYQLALFDLGLADFAPARAIPGIRAAADAGVPEAQYWLAWQYEAGPLLPDDPAAALAWYRAAAEQEHRLALGRLAAAYREGELGLAADARLAAEYAARAERCARR